MPGDWIAAMDFVNSGGNCKVIGISCPNEKNNYELKYNNQVPDPALWNKAVHSYEIF